jgi:hypothetical protein
LIEAARNLHLRPLLDYKLAKYPSYNPQFLSWSWPKKDVVTLQVLSLSLL